MGAERSVRRFAQVFDDVATAYDEIRPSYPPALVDAAIERGALDSRSRVLEVGSGTGKLTELLVARGLRVDAVEPGPNMIEAARKRLGGATEQVRFHTGRFEDVALPDGAFAALFAAAAFHWIDPEIGWRKAASCLARGGVLALLAHCGMSDGEGAEAEAGFRDVLRKHAPEVADSLPPALDLETILAGAEERRGNVSAVWDWIMGEFHGLATDDAAELFDDVEVLTTVSTVEQTTDQFCDHIRTTSLYFRIDPASRAAFEEDERRLLDGLGGTLRFSHAAILVTARRR
jgi:SAM-dependent methyltransferase